MKDKLIILAKEKGFESKIVYSNKYKHSSNEDLRYLLWMTELQKELRDKYNCLVEVSFFKKDYKNELGWSVSVDNYKTDWSNQTEIDYYKTYFINHDKALEDGLYNALKMELK